MKYQEIAKWLTQLLRSENASFPDGRFYSERDIAQKYGVSRSTAHRAIEELCRQGDLIQIHGSGTFVKSTRETQSLFSVTSCAQSYYAMGLHPQLTVLRRETIHASPQLAEKLGISAGEPVLLLDILYRADRMVLNETISYLPLGRFPHVERLDFSQRPLLEILQTRYGAHAKATQSTLQAILPPAGIAENLGITVNTPILLFESVTSGLLNGRTVPFEHFLCYYRTDQFGFTVSQEYETRGEPI